MYMKDEFTGIAKKYIKREGIDQLLDWLSLTDFYTAPASSRFHGSCEGGLVMHSLNVFKRLKDLVEVYDDGTISYESQAIVALFHDLCKVNYYSVGTRNQKTYDPSKVATASPYQVKRDSGGAYIWESVPYYTVDEHFSFGGHGSKSMFLVMNFIKLYPDEAAAINCHMGPWDRQDYGRPGEVFDKNLLAWMLHVADEAATYIDKT